MANKWLLVVLLLVLSAAFGVEVDAKRCGGIIARECELGTCLNWCKDRWSSKHHVTARCIYDSVLQSNCCSCQFDC
ncbi:hypothetical protein ABFX02_02G071100 [Erythranthe guttata]